LEQLLRGYELPRDTTEEALSDKIAGSDKRVDVHPEVITPRKEEILSEGTSISTSQLNMDKQEIANSSTEEEDFLGGHVPYSSLISHPDWMSDIRILE
jgi:hypothetical protein